MQKPISSLNIYHNKYSFSTSNEKEFSEQSSHRQNENSTKNTNQTNNSQNNHINYEQHPILKYFFSKNIKTKKLPCFEVYSSQIEILNQPMDFYLALIVNYLILMINNF